MGNIINFGKAAKKVSKIKKEKLAKEKCIKHSQKKLTRSLIKREKKALTIHLDSHKVDNTDSKGNRD